MRIAERVVVGYDAETSSPIMETIYRDMTPEEESNRIEGTDAPEKTQLDIIEAKLNALLRFQGLSVKEIGMGVYEVIKDTNLPSGDYINPIDYVAGMNVTTGMWYTNGDDIWEATKDGVPKSFEDTEYFDIISY